MQATNKHKGKQTPETKRAVCIYSILQPPSNVKCQEKILEVLHMNNFRPFGESYTEVTIPLDSKMISAFEQSEYAYLLDDFNRENKNPAYSSVGVSQ